MKRFTLELKEYDCTIIVWTKGEDLNKALVSECFENWIDDRDTEVGQQFHFFNGHFFTQQNNSYHYEYDSFFITTSDIITALDVIHQNTESSHLPNIVTSNVYVLNTLPAKLTLSQQRYLIALGDTVNNVNIAIKSLLEQWELADNVELDLQELDIHKKYPFGEETFDETMDKIRNWKDEILKAIE